MTQSEYLALLKSFDTCKLSGDLTIEEDTFNAGIQVCIALLTDYVTNQSHQPVRKYRRPLITLISPWQWVHTKPVTVIEYGFEITKYRKYSSWLQRIRCNHNVDGYEEATLYNAMYAGRYHRSYCTKCGAPMSPWLY